MNTILTFLTKHWQRLPLEGFKVPPRLSSVAVTPRFRASSHIIFFVLADGEADPLLVVKVPRLPGDNRRLDREAANLRLVHTAYAGGFASIPRVVAYEDCGEHRLLIETALQGRTMGPAVVRCQPQICIETVLTWLIDLHHATTASSMYIKDWHQRIVAHPLAHFATVFPLSGEEKCLLERTRDLIAPLRDADMPLVFEHGDLSAPNLLLHGKDHLGVVDWELAEPQGLPAVDLFFFLTYIAFAQRRFPTQRHNRVAFHNAFFGPTAWAQPYVRRYAEHLHLSPAVLKPLFVLCWSRYVANIILRLNDLHGPEARLSHATAAWLRTNRYYTLWRHTVDHIAALNL